MAKGKVYVATESFFAVVGENHYSVKKGDRVREGHSLLNGRMAFFMAADEGVLYDVEEATQRPGAPSRA